MCYILYKRGASTPSDCIKKAIRIADDLRKVSSLCKNVDIVDFRNSLRTIEGNLFTDITRLSPSLLAAK